jgi:hypothetical protein
MRSGTNNPLETLLVSSPESLGVAHPTAVVVDYLSALIVYAGTQQ